MMTDREMVMHLELRKNIYTIVLIIVAGIMTAFVIS